MKKLQIKRLNRLANVLNQESSGRNQKKKYVRTKNRLRILDCAMEGVGQAFNKHFDYDEENNTVVCIKTGVPSLGGVASFIGLSMDEVMHLFTADYFEPNLGGKQLAYNATGKELASNIRDFIKVKKQLVLN